MSTEPLTLTVPDELLEALARRVTELLLQETGGLAATRSPWLDFNGALSYLGFTRDKLYRLTAAKAISFRKKENGQELLFHRDELDHWLESRYPQEGWLP